ncbi:MAG: hypothetical protein KatS3mg100_388 [Candidatus Parcubacteria bacterium]|nr:MAG: hypothetical protein KatS3mg100_388 [Candidatus Parcubacteria bacterium]
MKPDTSSSLEQNHANPGRWVVAAACGTLFALWMITAFTIGGELVGGIKGWLKAAFGHHWVGKGVLAGIAFLLGSGASYLLPFQQGDTWWVRLVVWHTVLFLILLLGFFAWMGLGNAYH